MHRAVALTAVLLALTGPALATARTTDQLDRLKRLSIEELLELEITSVSRRAEPLRAAAAAISVITREDIRRSGATTLADAMRLATGIHVARFDSRTWSITARGFATNVANKMLVLVDGRSVYTPLFSGVFWDVQDVLLDDVERIEVIRGPGAAQWGANAVNGVINILTRSARDTQGAYGLVAAGSEIDSWLAARYGGALGERGHYRAWARYADNDGLALAGGGDAGDDRRQGRGGVRADWQDGNGDRWELAAEAYAGSIGHPRLATTDVDGGHLRGRWQRTLSAASELEAQFWYDHTFRRVPQQFTEDRDTAELELQHDWQASPRQRVLWGALYRVSADQTRDSPVIRWVPSDRSVELFRVFAQSEIELIPGRLALSGGTALESNDSTGLELQPSLRLGWHPSPESLVWASVSRAVRTPTRIDEDVRFLVGPTVILTSDHDFESEEVLAWELGMRTAPAQGWSVDAAAFYNEYDRLRSQEPPATGALPVRLGNGLAARTRGIELDSRYQMLPRLRWQLGATWLDTEFRRRPGSRDLSGGAAEGNDPEFHGLLRASLDLPRDFELDALLRRVGALPDPAVPAYTELDLRLGWPLRPELELALVGQNLLQSRHPEFGPATAAREEVERSWHLRLSWRP